MKKDLESIRNYFKEKNIQPSIHRLKIYQYLISTLGHPTAEEIFNALIKEVPTLSKTTVYNTMRYFLEKGIVSDLTISENEVRYDVNTTPHAHFRCVRCGRIFDVDLEKHCWDMKEINGNKILKQQVYLIGICKDCLEKESNFHKEEK